MENQPSGEMKLARPWVPVVGVVFAVAVIAGVGFMGNGANAACTRDVEYQGTCEGSAWGKWGVISFAANDASCSASLFEQRAYKGTRTIIHGSFKFPGGLGGCGFASEPPSEAAGVITSQRVSCEIVETRIRAVEGSKRGACVPPSEAAGAIRNDGRTDMTGSAAAAAEQSPGTYRDYLNAVGVLKNGQKQQR